MRPPTAAVVAQGNGLVKFAHSTPASIADNPTPRNDTGNTTIPLLALL